MPEILTGQTFVLENVLSFQFTASQEKIEASFASVDEFLKKKKLTKGSPIATATLGGQVVNDIQFIEMKVLIPVGKKFKSTDNFEYLSEFRIDNALKITHKGNPNNIMETIQQFVDYISEHKLTPSTPLYNVTVKEGSSLEDADSMVVDVYIGVAEGDCCS